MYNANTYSTHAATCIIIIIILYAIPRTLMKELAQFNIQDCTNVKDSSPTHRLRAGEGRNVRGANPPLLSGPIG